MEKRDFLANVIMLLLITVALFTAGFLTTRMDERNFNKSVKIQCINHKVYFRSYRGDFWLYTDSTNFIRCGK